MSMLRVSTTLYQSFDLEIVPCEMVKWVLSFETANVLDTGGMIMPSGECQIEQMNGS